MSATQDFLKHSLRPDGMVAVDWLVDDLRITKSELAVAAGLSRDAILKSARLKSRRTQRRLGEIVEIINRILPWAGSVQAAFAWYRSQSLPGFGGQTAEDLVKAGRGEDVRRYLSDIAAGGYA